MKTFLCTMAMILATLLALPQAQAISITLEPRTGRVFSPPANVFFDVDISNLGSNVLGAYSLDVHYDPTLFNFLALVPAGWGGALGNVRNGEALGQLDLSTPGLIRISEVSLLDDAALDVLQLPGSNRLLTLGLYAFNTDFEFPTTIVSADNFVLSDGAGDRLIPSSERAALVFRVPEPSTPALLVIGAFGALLLRRLGRVGVRA